MGIARVFGSQVLKVLLYELKVSLTFKMKLRKIKWKMKGTSWKTLFRNCAAFSEVGRRVNFSYFYHTNIHIYDTVLTYIVLPFL